MGIFMNKRNSILRYFEINNVLLEKGAICKITNDNDSSIVYYLHTCILFNFNILIFLASVL